MHVKHFKPLLASRMDIFGSLPTQDAASLASITEAGTLAYILSAQVSSPSQAAARKQQHASSPSRISLRQRRELEQANEQQRQDITRSAIRQLPFVSLGTRAERVDALNKIFGSRRPLVSWWQGHTEEMSWTLP